MKSVHTYGFDFKYLLNGKIKHNHAHSTAAMKNLYYQLTAIRRDTNKPVVDALTIIDNKSNRLITEYNKELLK